MKMKNLTNWLRCFVSVNLLIAIILLPNAAVSKESTPNPIHNSTDKQVDVTADQSLEWYQDQQIYVARGNAKAVRGDLVVEADVLSAHEREKKKLSAEEKAKQVQKSDNLETGDIDTMTAEGHVHITNSMQKVSGDHANYDLDKHYMIVTGNNLKYETDKDTVTSQKSLEYWEDKKIAVARGNAVGVREDKHVEGDILSAEFRENPNGENVLWKMTADGHVKVITKSDVSQGDHLVYDINRNIVVINGHVKITRKDGTELAGDVGEVDFSNNQSRLLNRGKGRVHALLPSRSNPLKTDAESDQTPGDVQ